MKTIKLLFLLLTFTSVSIISCSDENPIENPGNAQESVALRTALNQIKIANDISGRTEQTNPFCFEFVFPITFAYNNGTLITVANMDGLIEILSNETLNLYLSAVVFPFQVHYGGTVHTIHNESEFTELLQLCGYNTWDDDIVESFCFDIVYPITVDGPENQTITIHSNAELIAYFENPANGSEDHINFPISVIYNNETVVIHTIYEFYDMVNNCNVCACPEIYAPVCVQTAAGIMEFGNMCHAECAGFTQNDLVPCNTSDCSITNIHATVGDCNINGTYHLTIDFDYTNAGGTNFQVFSSSGVQVGLGTYPLSALPITIEQYSTINATVDFLTVVILNNENCTAAVEWQVPNCDGCDCPTTGEPVCVQTSAGTQQFDNECLALCAGFTGTDFVNCDPNNFNFGELLGNCFTMGYPLQIQTAGMLVTVHTDAELLQYWSPSMSVPSFHYPVTLIFANLTQTVGSQGDVEFLINANCN